MRHSDFVILGNWCFSYSFDPALRMAISHCVKREVIDGRWHTQWNMVHLRYALAHPIRSYRALASAGQGE